MRKQIGFAILALGFFNNTAWAQDAGLYDPLPPEGSAFVRFLSESPDTSSLPTKANDKNYDYITSKQVTTYYVVPQGDVKTSIGAATQTFKAEPGKFYTVVLNDGNTIDVKTDPQNDNQAKSQIIFYNLSDKDNLSLRTTDGKVIVVPPLASGAVGDKQINPVKVSLGVFDGDTLLKDLGPISLERSSSYSAIVMNDNDIQWVRSSTSTTR